MTVLNYENRLLAILSLTFGIVLFDRLSLSYLMPWIAKDLSLSNTQIGLLASGLSLAWAFSGYVFGAYSDRTGNRKPMLVGAVVLFSLFTMLSGLAAGFASLLAARLLMGLFEGPVLPIGQSIMASESSEHRRGLNMGVLQNAGANLLGLVIAPLALVALSEAYSWRTAFFIAGLPGLAAAYLIWRHVRSRPLPAAAPARQAEGKPRFGEIVRQRNIAVCMIISSLMLGWYVLILSFLPLYLVTVRGFTAGQMGMIMSGLGIAAVIASAAVPALSDRFGRKPIMIIFALVGVLTPLVPLLVHASPLATGLMIALAWSCIGFFSLFMATVPAESVRSGSVASSLGLVMGAGEILGGTLAPAIGGVAADMVGLGAPLWIAAGSAGLAAVASFFVRETAPRALAGSASAPIDEQNLVRVAQALMERQR